MSVEVARLYNNELYDPEVDITTPVGEVHVLVDHPSWDKPKKAAYIDQTPAPTGNEITEQQILDLLGVPDVVSSTDLEGLAAAEAGKSLVDDAEITKLGNLTPSQVILLSAASDVAGKISGATKPSGWTLTASSTDLVIEHTLTGKQLSGVIVKEINGSVKRVCVPFEDAYSGITENGTTITIEGINPTALALTIILSFV